MMAHRKSLGLACSPRSRGARAGIGAGIGVLVGAGAAYGVATAIGAYQTSRFNAVVQAGPNRPVPAESFASKHPDIMTWGTLWLSIATGAVVGGYKPRC